MPIYEYQCEACNNQFEVLQKISDALLVECPQCKKGSLRKKVSAAAFRLKGGGWYETDFKTSGKKNLASGSGDAAPSGSGDKSGDKSGEKSSEKSSDKSSGDSAGKKPSGDSSSKSTA
jgi:putative FmdB family regulatory protein